MLLEVRARRTLAAWFEPSSPEVSPEPAIEARTEGSAVPIDEVRATRRPDARTLTADPRTLISDGAR
jgi:hypothetical protein